MIDRIHAAVDNLNETVKVITKKKPKTPLVHALVPVRGFHSASSHRNHVSVELIKPDGALFLKPTMLLFEALNFLLDALKLVSDTLTFIVQRDCYLPPANAVL